MKLLNKLEHVRWLLILKLITLFGILYLVLFSPSTILNAGKYIIQEIWKYILNNKENPIIIAKDFFIILLIFLILYILTEKLIKRLKFNEFKPKNTYSKGDARWSTEKELRKSYLFCDMDNILKTGWLLGRRKIIKISVLGFPIIKINSKWYRENKDKVKELEEITNEFQELTATLSLKQEIDYRISESNLYKNHLKKFKIKLRDDSIINKLLRWLQIPFKLLKRLFSVTYHDYGYFDTDPVHTVVEGGTRSYKTVGCVLPQIDALSRAKVDLEKQSMMISDPKGELFRKTSKFLINRGYKVLVLNVQDYEESQTYNPLSRIVNLYLEEIKGIDIDYHYKKYSNDSFFVAKVNHPTQVLERIYDDINKDRRRLKTEKDIEYNKFVKTKKFKNDDERIKFQLEFYKDVDNVIYFTRTQIEIRTLVNALCPINEGDSNGGYFQKGAQGLLNSMILFMIETAVATDQLDQVNLFNLSSQINILLSEYVGNGDSAKPVYQMFIEKLKPSHGARMSYPFEIGKTLNNMKSTATSCLLIFTDAGIGGMTSKNQLDLIEIAKGDDPYAIFLIVPEDNTTFHNMISIFVNQLYVTISDYAKKNGFKRKMAFTLDEFGNIPEIPDFNAKITVSLGKGVQFYIIVQDVEQIAEIYGDSAKDIFLNNAHNKIYLLQSSKDGWQRFSQQIGSTTIVKRNVNGQELDESSASWNEEEKPLITEKQLEKAPIGEIYLSSARKNPAIMYQRFSFEYFKMEELTPEEYFVYENFSNLHNGVPIDEFIFNVKLTNNIVRG